MGLGSFLFGDDGGPMPEVNHASLDPNTSRLLNNKLVDATISPDFAKSTLADQEMKGVQSASNLLKGGGIDGATNEALQRRQQRQFASTQNQMQKSAEMDAPKIQAARTQQTLGIVRNDSQAASDFAKQTLMTQQNKTFARNNAINSILGTVGTAVGAGAGAAIGGWQGGAMGANLGGGLARSVGPTGGNLNYL